MNEKRMQTVQLIWLLVEVFCIIRSAIASYNVTMNLANGDTLFAVFTVGVIELSLFAMLIMAGVEVVAPIAALVLIAFSGVLQYAELALVTSAMDEQSKTMLRYAVSFAPTVLLLVALMKRMTESDAGNVFDNIGTFAGGLFGWLFNRGANNGTSEQEQTTFASDTPKPETKRTRKRKGKDANPLA